MSLNAEQIVEEAKPVEKTGPDIGLFDGISNHDYHYGKGISKSGLDLIRQNPAEFITRKRHPKPPTPAMLLGSAFHCLVLEPEKFDQEYVMEPMDAPRRPTAAQINAKKPSPDSLAAIEFWKQWDAENEGKTAISTKPGDDPFWQPSDWCRLHRMRDAILLHPIASILLDPSAGRAEQTCYWVDWQTKKLCKCRPDFINDDHNLLVDLKSTEDASYTGFGQSVSRYRYHVQDAYYRDGMHQIGHTVGGFVFVAVEKQPPYNVAVYRLGQEEVRVGRLQYESDLMKYKQCHEADEWPGYPDEVRDLTLSQFQLRGFIS
ncbi:PD-(D/E)XK nuclease-like domain-containing protein [Primorskyibacter sedentarius]|uniref:PD-(D/E)XK nuclease-like domain-containing protein n=1 Tax=Primorskyibacter sedentarius TaxID=745311 RepID=UPI003EBC1138